MLWIRYRKVWADGPGPWQWLYSESPPGIAEADLQELKLELAKDDQHRDQFRGVDAEEAVPPLDVIEGQLLRLQAQTQDQARAVNETADLLKSLMSKLK